MSSGIGNVFNSMKGLMQSSKPVSRPSHVDHPLAQTSPILPKSNPNPSTPPLVPPKRQNNYTGGIDPRIEHVRARRVSEMGPVGNPAKSSSHGEGGGWDDRAEARLVGQERNQEGPKRQNSYAGGIDPKIEHVRARRASEMGPVGNPAKFSSHGEGGEWDGRAEARLGHAQERNQEERSVESRRKIEKLRLEVRVLREEKEVLKRQILGLQAQAVEADTKHRRSLEKAKRLHDENERLLSDIKSITSDVAAREQATARRITEVESRNQQQDEEIRTLRQRILQSDEKQVNTDRLLQVRTADLKGVETFLTTADEYSGAEIMMMVESLNGEIFQISAFMAETLENESQVATPEEHAENITRFRKALEFSQHYIGASLFSHLKDNAAKVRTDALPLQLGLQALLTTWCTIMVRSWISSSFDNDLQNLYSYIRNSDGQSIAGRWRAITCAQTRILASETRRNQVIDTLLGLMCLCGWSISVPESQKVVVSLHQMVERIEKMWIRLKRATKEGITNTDMEVFTFGAGEPFGEGMEDMYADALGKKPVEDVKRRRRERTLCTVAIGLRKTSVKRIDGTKPIIQADVLIKPKVALASVLLEGDDGGMLGEPRPKSQYFGK